MIAKDAITLSQPAPFGAGFLSRSRCDMLKMLANSSLLVAVFLCAGCRSNEQIDAQRSARKAEEDKLQGNWKMVACEGEGGVEAEPPQGGYLYLSVEGESVKTIAVPKDGKEEVLFKRKMTIAPASPYKRIDLFYYEDSSKSTSISDAMKIIDKRIPPSRVSGVYKVDGDKLQICLSHDPASPPADLTAPADSAHYLITLQRLRGADHYIERQREPEDFPPIRR